MPLVGFGRMGTCHLAGVIGLSGDLVLRKLMGAAHCVLILLQMLTKLFPLIIVYIANHLEVLQRTLRNVIADAI